MKKIGQNFHICLRSGPRWLIPPPPLTVIFKYKNIKKILIISRQCVPLCGMVPLVSRLPSLAIQLYFPAWIPSKGSNTQLLVSMACDSTRSFVCLFVLVWVCSCCMRENNISSFGLKCTMKTYPTSVSVNASRYCEDDGTWSNQTNYLDCYCKGSLVHR